MKHCVWLSLPLAVCGLACAESKSPIATVSSRAPFAVEGVDVPVAGGAAWPVAAGDVIETKAGPAEVRLKDGTRIFIPAQSRYVVGSANLRAGMAAPRVAPQAVPQTSAATVRQPRALLSILEGGAIVGSPGIDPMAVGGSAPRATNTTPTTLSLESLLTAFGPNSPVISAIDQAIGSKGAVVQYDAATKTYYITGIQAVIGNGPAQQVTILVSATQVTIDAGNVAPGTLPSQPLLTVTAGTTSGCKGSSNKPADVSNSIISVPSGSSC